METFIDKQGGTDADRLENIWNSKELCFFTKVRFFNINAKSVLLIELVTKKNPSRLSSAPV